MATQQYLDKGNVLTVKSVLLSWSLFKKLSKKDNSAFIFHEQYTLLNFIMIYFHSKILRKKNKFIYDIHDILRLNKNASIKYKLAFFYPIKMLEKLVIKKFKVDILTVSKGLSQFFSKNTGKQPHVFYNIPPQKIDKESILRSKLIDKNASKAIYFGQIYQDRIALCDIRNLSENGLKVFVSGRFPSYVKEDFRTDLVSLSKESGGNFLGEYDPLDMSFIKSFRYSIMLFKEKSVNITYCMPNKLFQSLMQGLVCISSPHLKELREEFEGTGYVISSDSVSYKDLDLKPNVLIEKLEAIKIHNENIFKNLNLMV